MELTPKQQVVEILKGKQKVLILTHENPDGDALGSAVALYLTLNRMGKDVAIACQDQPGAVFSFLPEIDKISNDFPKYRDFVISLDVSKVKADKVMYQVQDGKLNVIITPKNGQFAEELVSFPAGAFNCDVIVVLDSPDLERLGSIYAENTEMFYEVPLVNIDHHPGNDNFGTINLVDLTSTSTSEILVSLIEAVTGDSKFFDEHIATALLTGIITDTNSFQNHNTTPKSLTVAAQLVAAGARQQDIIKFIYKTKPLSTLKLWGRALANIVEENDARFIWSSLSAKDYIGVGAESDESAGLIDELLKTAPNIDFALLLSEKDGDLHGSMRATSAAIDVAKIAGLFGGGGHTMAAGFQIDKADLSKAPEIIEKIKKYQLKLNA